MLVNALNRIFKSNLPLNNLKWLLTKLELSCVRNIIPRYKSGASKSRPRWAAYTRIGNVWEYPPPPLRVSYPPTRALKKTGKIFLAENRTLSQLTCSGR